MTTIITIHGTFASGEENGDAWWQKGSAFQNAVDHFSIGSSANHISSNSLAWQPFIWIGDNSEIERRKAADNLLAYFEKLEKKGEEYAVIAHSHGGSVLSSALLAAARKGLTLSCLQKWITVGTPFIEYEKSGLLLQRLNRLEKLIYLSILTVVVFYVSKYFGDSLIGPDFFDLSEWPGILIVTTIGLSPFLLLHFGFRAFKNRKLHHKNKMVCDRANLNFSSRFVSIWHPNDEAIFGLQSAHAPMRLFQPNFSVAAIGNLSIYMFPAIVAYMFWLPITPEDVREYLNIPVRQSTHILDGMFEEENWFYYLIDQAIPNKLGLGGIGAWYNLFLFPLMIFTSSAVTLLLADAFARAVSPVISNLFNSASQSALQKSATGNDVLGEKSVTVCTSPFWIDAKLPPLNVNIAKRISEKSDLAAAQALSALRKAFGPDFSSANINSKMQFFNTNFSANELIHTTYFSVPEFREYISIVIFAADESPLAAKASGLDTSVTGSTI